MNPVLDTHNHVVDFEHCEMSNLIHGPFLLIVKWCQECHRVRRKETNRLFFVKRKGCFL